MMFYFQWNKNTNNSTSIEFGAPVTQWLEFGVVTGQSQGCVICQGFVHALINALFPVSAWHLLCNGEVYLFHQAPWVPHAYL